MGSGRATRGSTTAQHDLQPLLFGESRGLSTRVGMPALLGAFGGPPNSTAVYGAPSLANDHTSNAGNDILSRSGLSIGRYTPQMGNFGAQTALVNEYVAGQISLSTVQLP
jgi:hypothetical protein